MMKKNEHFFISRYSEPQEEIVTIGYLPMFHVFGLFVYLFSFLKQPETKETIVILPRFNETDFLNCIQVGLC